MKRLLFLAVAGLAACCPLGSADTPPGEAPAPPGDYYDLVYFAESRPVLLRVHVTGLLALPFDVVSATPRQQLH